MEEEDPALPRGRPTRGAERLLHSLGGPTAFGRGETQQAHRTLRQRRLNGDVDKHGDDGDDNDENDGDKTTFVEKNSKSSRRNSFRM